MIVALAGALVGIWLHELAHLSLAAGAGDRSGYIAGRLTLNPFAQFTPVGTFLLPVLGMHLFGVAFGWGKRAPIELAHCVRWGIPGLYLIVLGPCVLNLVLALIGWWVPGLLLAAQANLAIGLVNLLPVPGTDGWNALRIRRLTAVTWRGVSAWR